MKDSSFIVTNTAFQLFNRKDNMIAYMPEKMQEIFRRLNFEIENVTWIDYPPELAIITVLDEQDGFVDVVVRCILFGEGDRISFHKVKIDEKFDLRNKVFFCQKEVFLSNYERILSVEEVANQGVELGLKNPEPIILGSTPNLTDLQKQLQERKFGRNMRTGEKLFKVIAQTFPRIIYKLKPTLPLFEESKMEVLFKEVALIENSLISEEELKKQFEEFARLDNEYYKLIAIFFFHFQGKQGSRNYQQNRQTLFSLIGGVSNKEKVSNNKVKSKIYLSKFLPIFNEFKSKENGQEKVVERLSPFEYSFKQLDDSSGDLGEVEGPIGYKQENLLSFNEILFRIVDFPIEDKEISEKEKGILKGNSKSLSYSYFVEFSEIRKCLVKEGFVECNSSKFESVENNKLANATLEYRPKITLRDDPVISLIDQVLLKNLNQGNNLYPIFELSYCPGRSQGQLSILSIVLLKTGNEKYISEGRIFFYTLEELYDILKDQLFKGRIEIRPLKELKQSQVGITEFAHIFDKKNNHQIGIVRVHRLEAFEIRHMEILSIRLDLKSFY